jgi:YHS domain-containing protein
MKKIVVTICVTVLTGISLFAQKSAVFVHSGKAIRGYDPVAYFTEGKPVKGDVKLVYNWNKADWYFSSQKNLDLFKASPEKYAPQYGGYCAFGLSNGYKAPTDADAWTIENDKLYLNYNLQVRQEWNKDRQQRIKQADQNWPSVRDKE